MTSAHLDDESLSSALDEEDAAAADHLAGCAACQDRSNALDAARRAVATWSPIGVAPGLADRAVAAALAAYAAERAATPSSSPTAPDGDGGPVVPLRPPGSFTSRGTSPAASRRRVPGWALGAAAALVAVLVAVPLISGGTGNDVQQTATGTSDERATDAKAAAGTGPVVDGGDLGEQSDQLALGGVLAGAVTGRSVTPPTEADLATPGAGAAGSRATEPSAEAGAEPSPAALAAAPAPTALPVPPVTAAPGAGTTAEALAGTTCEGTVRAEYADGLGPLLYRATLRWQGTPSVLLAYRLADTSGNGPDRRAFVMALDGCRLLVVQGF